MLESVRIFLTLRLFLLSFLHFTFTQEIFPTPFYTTELEFVSKMDRRRLFNVSAPLFEGIGTHYSFIWVGTPPQRVSVIMDTGSHHTAFPCVGCNCGKRVFFFRILISKSLFIPLQMDPFFDPAKSISSLTKKCGINSGKCFFRQSYSEGSSWHAYKVVDKLYIGGKNNFLSIQ